MSLQTSHFVSQTEEGVWENTDILWNQISEDSPFKSMWLTGSCISRLRAESIDRQ